MKNKTTIEVDFRQARAILYMALEDVELAVGSLRKSLGEVTTHDAADGSFVDCLERFGKSGERVVRTVTRLEDLGGKLFALFNDYEEYEEGGSESASVKTAIDTAYHDVHTAHVFLLDALKWLKAFGLAELPGESLTNALYEAQEAEAFLRESKEAEQ